MTGPPAPSLEECRAWRKDPRVIADARHWWADERAMWEKHRQTGEVDESEFHFGFAFAASIPKDHPRFFVTILAIADAAEDIPDSLTQLGLAEMGFFLACCDEAYVDRLESLVPESAALKALLGRVYRSGDMSDARYARIRAMAPDLNASA